jgi:Putative zinc dependent peptidase (DUF5700)
MSRLLALAVGLLVFAPASPRRSDALEFSGIDAFWPVYDALVRDREPDTSAWAALFATPGYAALEARERRRGAIESALRFALMPSRARLRDSVERAGGFVGRAVRHLRSLPAARDSVARFRAALERSQVVVAARRVVAAFLPAGLPDSVPPPPVSFVFFLDDGRGYPALVVADLLLLTRVGVDTGYFAHEFFHFYRRHIAIPTRGATPSDVGVEELLAYPAEEGIADQLDKRRYVEGSDSAFAVLMARPGARGYAASYRAAYRRSSEMMAVVSRALERTAAAPDSATAIARAARDSLPDQGRALGAFMARTIDDVEGRAALVAVAGDPFRFWLAYDAAAVRAGGDRSRLSAKALAVLRRSAR